MNAVAIVGLALSLATEVLKLINTEQSRKFIDRSVKIQLEIQQEEAKGYDADDAKLEALYKEAKVICDAAKQEIALFAAKRTA
jgi:hypothetical protein